MGSFVLALILQLTRTQIMSTTSWAEDRFHKVKNQCPCLHCAKSSNICSHCKRWDTINWDCKQSPHIKCSNCKQSFHFDCLPPKFQRPNSWKVCSDIDNETQCSTYLDLFSFFNKIEIAQYSQEHESLIHKLWIST